MFGLSLERIIFILVAIIVLYVLGRRWLKTKMNIIRSRLKPNNSPPDACYTRYYYRPKNAVKIPRPVFAIVPSTGPRRETTLTNEMMETGQMIMFFTSAKSPLKNG